MCVFVGVCTCICMRTNSGKRISEFKTHHAHITVSYENAEMHNHALHREYSDVHGYCRQEACTRTHAQTVNTEHGCARTWMCTHMDLHKHGFALSAHSPFLYVFVSTSHIHTYTHTHTAVLKRRMHAHTAYTHLYTHKYMHVYCQVLKKKGI
jgi:hypothetical protein